MLWIAHDVGREDIKGEKVSDLCFLCLWVHLFDHIGVYHSLAWSEIVFYFLFSVQKLYLVFSILLSAYSRPSLISLVRLAISFLPMGLRGNVGSSGRL